MRLAIVSVAVAMLAVSSSAATVPSPTKLVLHDPEDVVTLEVPVQGTSEVQTIRLPFILQAVSETTAAPLVTISLSLKVSLQLWGFTSPLRDSATFVLPNGLSKYTGSTCKFEVLNSVPSSKSTLSAVSVVCKRPFPGTFAAFAAAVNADLATITAEGQFSLDSFGGSVSRGMGPLVTVQEAVLGGTIANSRPVTLGIAVDGGRFRLEGEVPEEEQNELWTYEGHKGPAYWGKLKNSTSGALLFPACAGTQQSPIDITTSSAVFNAAPLVRKYTTSKFQIVQRPGGHPGFQVKPLGGEAYLMVDGLRFDLLQFHFHSSSEHTLNGKSYPLEVHFVHANTQTPGVTKLAVWGILFPSTKTTDNALLSSFWGNITDSISNGININLKGLIQDSDVNYYRYTGSLTTPPCTEGVNWHVTVASRGVSSEDVDTFEEALHQIQNFRKPLPTNGRVLTKLRRAANV